MSQRLTETKNIWLTGASSGIGQALAHRLLSDGHKVVVSARNLAGLQQLQQEFPKTCVPFVFDVTNTNALVEAQAWLASNLGYLDIVILNAGICEYMDVQALSSELVARVCDTNFMGSVRTLEVALPLLRRAPEPGHIVGISSMVTLLPLPRSQAYGASKAALEYFLLSLAVDLAAEQITVSIVRPGFVKTPLTNSNDFPMPFLQSTEQAVTAIIKAIAKRKLISGFPLRLVALMRVIAMLPTSWQLMLLKKTSRNIANNSSNGVGR